MQKFCQEERKGEMQMRWINMPLSLLLKIFAKMRRCEEGKSYSQTAKLRKMSNFPIWSPFKKKKLTK